MATYVKVTELKIEKIFDDKLKKEVLAKMTSIVNAAIKDESKLTSDAPKDKTTRGWELLGKLSSMAVDGDNLRAKSEFQINVIPGPTLARKVPADSKLPLGKTGKPTQADAIQLIEAQTKAAMEKAITFMSSKEP